MGSNRDGSTTFDDPAAPWVLRMWTDRTPTGRSTITRLLLDARTPQIGITAVGMARLPTAQMLHIAVTTTQADDVYYRMLARPKTGGRRGDVDHWHRVLTVWQWGEDTRGCGGGVRAIADMWGVAYRPTAFRWHLEARKWANLRSDPVEGVAP